MEKNTGLSPFQDTDQYALLKYRSQKHAFPD